MKNLSKNFFLLLYGQHPYVTIFSWNWLYVRKIAYWYRENLSIFRNKVVIDYGAGTSPYYGLIKDDVSKYIALDFYDNDIKTKGIEKIKLCNDGSIPSLVMGEADVILSNQVIMEVDSLEKYFSNINKLSKKGSKLFLTSPFMQTLGPNDNFRISPAYISKILKRNGFELLKYSTAGYFFVGAGLSWNMAMILKNEYNFNKESVVSIKKMIFFTPIIFLTNILSIGLDRISPLYRSPSNFLIIARKK
jgi:hypothetical protein